MKKLILPITALAFAGCVCCCKDDCRNSPYGNWSLELPYETMHAGSIILSAGEDGAPKAFALWRWGSPEWCSEVKVEGNRFSLRHPYGQRIEGAISGDWLYGRIAPCDKKTGALTGAWQPFGGWRNLPVCGDVKTSDAKLGEPIDLLKDGLAGWKAMDTKAPFGWSMKTENGEQVLSNCLPVDDKGKKRHGSNLMTLRNDFYDFNLAYDVRVPKDSNSGVYLRGRYEIQTLDSYGKPVDMHNMAAYYGRVTPSVAAEKPAGEWQHVDVTLYKRHLTVVLNGTTIIDNAPVVGITGGAIDANEFVKGPIYLQGDHSDADYKNMILRPCVK